MVTTVGTPQIIAAQELRIECMFPADDATEARHRITGGGGVTRWTNSGDIRTFNDDAVIKTKGLGWNAAELLDQLGPYVCTEGATPTELAGAWIFSPVHSKREPPPYCYPLRRQIQIPARKVSLITMPGLPRFWTGPSYRARLRQPAPCAFHRARFDWIDCSSTPYDEQLRQSPTNNEQPPSQPDQPVLTDQLVDKARRTPTLSIESEARRPTLRRFFDHSIIRLWR
jgi:hypothetical protein